MAEEHNYGVLLANAHGIESRELRVAESLLQRRVDGMILLTQNPAVAERVSRITPCVVAGRQYSGKGVGVVATDDVAGAKSAVEYLIERGRRRILYVGCHDRGGPALDRWAGYSKALREAGYKVYEPIDMHASMQAAYEYARKAEDLHEYDAIFAFNDLIAIGLLRGLAEQGIRVPNDVALIGYDDIEVADFVSPRLTTVRIPKEEMGVWAAQFIIEQSGKKPSDVERIMHTLPTMLVRRESA